MRKHLAPLAAATVCASGCANAAMPEVTVEQAVAAVRDCAQATSPNGVDEVTLLDLGWQRVRASSDDGTSIKLDLIILGKEDGGPLIMSGKPGSERRRGCVITGGLDPAAGFDGLLAALSGNFQAAGNRDGNHQFRVGSDVAVAARGGDGGSFRIVVLESGEG